MAKKTTSGINPEGGGPLRGSVTAQITIKRRNVARNCKENIGRMRIQAIEGTIFVEFTSSKKQFAEDIYGA
jgi:hypothetical protein